MAVYEIIPTTNVSMADIRDTLNANNGSVDNTLGSFFTEDANINMWSRNKPVPHSLEFGDTAVIRKGYNGMHGLIIPYNTDANFAAVCTSAWSYKALDGYLDGNGKQWPMRLGDFRGYYPAAKKQPNLYPWRQSYLPIYSGTELQYFGSSMMLDLYESIDYENSVRLEEITILNKSLADMYLTLCIESSSGAKMFYQSKTPLTGNDETSEIKIRVNTNQDNFSSGATELGMTLSNGGTVTMYLFLASALVNPTSLTYCNRASECPYFCIGAKFDAASIVKQSLKVMNIQQQTIYTISFAGTDISRFAFFAASQNNGYSKIILYGLTCKLTKAKGTTLSSVSGYFSISCMDENGEDGCFDPTDALGTGVIAVPTGKTVEYDFGNSSWITFNEPDSAIKDKTYIITVVFQSTQTTAFVGGSMSATMYYDSSLKMWKLKDLEV